MVPETTIKRKTLAILGVVAFVVVFCFEVTIMGTIINYKEESEPDIVGQPE